MEVGYRLRLCVDCEGVGRPGGGGAQAASMCRLRVCGDWVEVGYRLHLCVDCEGVWRPGGGGVHAGSMCRL